MNSKTGKKVWCWMVLMLSFHTTQAQEYGMFSSSVSDLLSVDYPHGFFLYGRGMDEPYYNMVAYNDTASIGYFVKWDQSTSSVELKWSGECGDCEGLNNHQFDLFMDLEDSCFYRQAHNTNDETIIFQKRSLEGDLIWAYEDTSFYRYNSSAIRLSNGHRCMTAYKYPEYHEILKLHYLEFDTSGVLLKDFLIPFTAYEALAAENMGDALSNLTELPNGDIILSANYKYMNLYDSLNFLQDNAVHHTTMVRFTPQGEVVWIKDINADSRLGGSFGCTSGTYGKYIYSPANHVFYVPYNKGYANWWYPSSWYKPIYDPGILKVNADTGDSLGFISAGVAGYQIHQDDYPTSFFNCLYPTEDGGVMVACSFHMYDQVAGSTFPDSLFSAAGWVYVKLDCQLNMEWRKFLYKKNGALFWADEPDTVVTDYSLDSHSTLGTEVYNLPNGDFEIVGGMTVDYMNYPGSGGYIYPDITFNSLIINACGEMDSTYCPPDNIQGLCEWEVQYNGVEEGEEDAGLLAYPNPSSGELNFQGTLSPLQLSIYNAMGQEVWKGKVNPGEPVHPSLSQGTYYLRYFYRDQFFSQPWLVMD